MHLKFTLWAKLGFYLFLSCMILTLVVWPLWMTWREEPKCQCSLILLLIIVTTFVLSWWFMGILFRFCSSGQFASGELPPSGKTYKDW